MKILVLSDTHLGQGVEGLTPAQRLADQHDVLQHIAALAHEEGCHAVLHAGDVYHRPNPGPAAEHVFRDFITALDPIPLVAITGNAAHDVGPTDSRSAPELFDDRARISRRPEVIQVAGLYIATLPNVPAAHLVAARAGGDRGEINAEMTERLIEIARNLRAEIPADADSILLLHWYLAGASLPNGLPVEAYASTPILPVDALAELGYSAVIAGDIHRGVVLNEQPPVFHVGSPMALDFGEAGFGHGVWLLDTADWVPRFVPVPSRPLITMDVAEPERLIELIQALPDDEFADAPVIRVRYTATREQAARIDQRALTQALIDAGAAAVQVRPEIVREERGRVQTVTEELGPVEAFDAWAATEEGQRRLVETGAPVGLDGGMVGSRLRGLLADWLQETA